MLLKRYQELFVVFVVCISQQKPIATPAPVVSKSSIEDQVFGAVESGLQQLIEVASDSVRKEFEVSIKCVCD